MDNFYIHERLKIEVKKDNKEDIHTSDYEPHITHLYSILL